MSPNDNDGDSNCDHQENSSSSHHHHGHKKTIVISGYSLRAPKSSSVSEFAEALKAGKDLTSSKTRYPAGYLGLPPRQGLMKEDDIKRFNPSFFGLNYTQAEAMDPTLRILLQVSFEALMDAQIDIESFRGSQTGVYIGHSFSDTLAYTTGPSNPKRKTGYEVVNGYSCMLANRLSYFYDLKGPSMMIDTGCSSSIVALDRAVRDIEAGIIDSAVVAGASLTLDPQRVQAFNALKALSPTGRCYSYDTRANGYCRSEGVACIILELGSDGYACIGGTGTNADGATAQGITYPSQNQQVALMRSVFKKSTIDPKTVLYHEGHGTGTVAGDKEELDALSKVYSHRIHIGSVKSNMGHAEPASGLFGLVKILLMNEDQMLYPNFGWKSGNHEAILSGKFSVVQSCQRWEKGPCTLSSFGLGGSNAFAILLPTTRKGFTFPSDRSSRLFQQQAGNRLARPFGSSLPKSSTTSMIEEKLSSSASPSRPYAEYYCIQRQLSNDHKFDYEQVNGKWAEKSPLVFVLDGQGSQWNKMGQDLMKNNSVFRATIERLSSDSGIALVDLYEDGTKWMEKTNAVIGIVSFQLGLIAMLESHGISPDYFLGHSLGEMACALLGGLQTEAEVMDVAKFRAGLVTLIETDSRLDIHAKSEKNNESDSYVFSSRHHIKRVDLSLPGDPDVLHSFSMRGAMAAIGCDAGTLEGIIDKIGLNQTCVACYNSPKGQTVSGPKLEVDQLLEEVKKANPATFIRTLDTDNVAYHAPYLEVFREHLSQEFTKKFGSIKNQSLPSSWISTSCGNTFGVDYIVNNICGKVHFQKAIESLPKTSTVIEIGPSSSLLSQIKRIRTDLKLVQLVERNKPFHLDTLLNTLKPQFSSNMEEDGELFSRVDCSQPWILGYKERYPDIWGSQTVFNLPDWKDYASGTPRKEDENIESSVTQTMCYNLHKAPWSSILDHNIRGQILFPVAGFIHTLWSSQGFKGSTELVNVKVKAPLLIAQNMQEVKLHVYQVGEYCEIRGVDNICHMTAYVKKVLPTTMQVKPEIDLIENALDNNHFYSHVRRLGYNYGPTYQVLDNVTPSHAKFGKKPKDWICYLDACLHLALHKSKSFFYPIGFDRVVFWGERLQKASMWIQKKSKDSFGNETILLDGIQKEFAANVTQSISTYSEKFVKYQESDVAEDPFLIASLLLRESSTFHVVEPITSPSLIEVVRLLRSISPRTRESKHATNLVISDGLYNDAQLLLTTRTKEGRAFHDCPRCVVARWGDTCLLRRTQINELAVEPVVVKDWQDVPKSNYPFVWHGDGASGAVACLFDERKDPKAMSYEGGRFGDDLIGLDKFMRHNYINDGVHGCWVDVPDASKSSDQKQVTPHAVLQISRPGILESLEWHELNPCNYNAEVKVSSLNFRDVMRAMGQLKEDDLRLGLEFSGVDILTKQRIFGFGNQTLATHTNAYYSFPTPENLSNEEAATIPVVYLTVYYALLHKANVRKGQSILIHAGAGGVGMAAITVARNRGLKIYTTCSFEKREFLKKRFGLEDFQIGDSRSDDFVNTVLKGTQQRGVDVVLNQLAGDLQVASLRCLAPGGNFCEIGKYDVMQHTSISLGLMADNISLHVIDLLPLFADPAYKPMFDDFLRDGFERKEIVPLPVCSFDAKDIVKAFRYMSQGKHLGKIVVNGYGSYDFPISQRNISMQGEIHLITGGLGGVGLALAYHLASLNCAELILVSRRGVTNSYQRQQISSIEAMNCKVRVLKSDVVDLTTSSASPDCIWHAATQYKDVAFDKMTEENWDCVAKPKVEGYLNLRRCWPTVKIIVTSSITAYFGSDVIKGQASYAWSNAFLDQAARKDPNTLSVRLGPIDDVGFITAADSNRKVFEMFDFITMKIDVVLEKLVKLNKEHQSGVFGIYSYKEGTISNNGIKQEKSGTEHLVYSLKDAQRLLATVMGGKPSQYHGRLKLTDAGLDSLSTMEVVNHIHEMTGSKSFKASDVNDSFVVQDIVSAIGACTSSVAMNNQIDLDRKNLSKEQTAEVSDELLDQESGNYNMKKDSSCRGNGEQKSTGIEDKREAIHNGNPGFHQQNSSSVCEFVGNGTIERENAIFSCAIDIGPHDIDFDSVLNALMKTKFVIFRQSDPIIFNHGAPLDSKEDAVANYMDQYVALAEAILVSKAIIIVVVEGEVRGGGMLFPALADICIATPASSFGLPEIHRGMVPAVVSQALKNRLGVATTRTLALTGKPISADKAHQISLVDYIVEASEMERELEGMLRRWEPRVSAAQFIKHDLFPRVCESMNGSGTRAGQWSRAQKMHELKLDNREVLRVSLIDGVATLTMCDSVTFNSATFEMSEAIRAIIPRLRAEAKVVILASGLENFHLGLQGSTARKFKNRPIHEAAAIVKDMFQGFVELALLGIPIIGVLNGRAYGGGVPVSLWCDYRIITSDVDLHVGNISRGVSPCGQLSRLLNEYFPKAEVMRHYLGNHHWYAKDLLRFGIVDHIKKTKTDALEEAHALAKFIAEQPSRGVRDSMHVLKVSHAAELIDEEAWLMAAKVVQTDECFSKKDHGSFHFHDKGNVPIEEDNQISAPQIQGSNCAVGIIAIEAYVPNYYIDADDLEGKNIPARTKNGQDALNVWDGQEDVISMALNAASMLLERHVKDPRMIGRIEVGTESNVDMSKSIKSYIMDLLPKDHKNVEGVDNTNACYGGAAAMINTLSWCRESEGRYGIVIATDTANMDLQDSSWRGASAVALLIGPNPWIEIQPERASCFKNSHDFVKPRFSTQVSPHVQGKTSMKNYIDALDSTMEEFRKLHSIDPSSLDTIVYHGGLSITFHKIIEKYLLMNFGSTNKATWQTTFEMMRTFSSKMGGLYTASMFVQLLSLLDSYNTSADTTKSKSFPPLHHIGLFAYGSGSTATLFHAKIHHERRHDINLGFKLAIRENVTFDILSTICKAQAEGVADVTLPRLKGRFYYDATKQDQIIREYFQEGTSKRLAPDSPEPYMVSVSKNNNNNTRTQDHDTKEQQPQGCDDDDDDEVVDNDDKNPKGLTGMELVVRRQDGNPESSTRIAILFSFLLGTLWWMSIAVLYEPILTDIFWTVILTWTTCSLLHWAIHRQSLSKTSRIVHPMSCSHFVQASVMYITFFVLYTISQTLFHKHWFTMALAWVTYVSGAMTLSPATWETLEGSTRLFWILHHNLTFFFLGLRPWTYGFWEDVCIHSCFLYIVAQFWNSTLNAYRHSYWGGGSTAKHSTIVTPQQMIWMRTGATVLEKSQQIYACSLLIVKGTNMLSWITFLVMVVMSILDLSFQMKVLCVRQPQRRNGSPSQ